MFSHQVLSIMVASSVVVGAAGQFILPEFEGSDVYGSGGTHTHGVAIAGVVQIFLGDEGASFEVLPIQLLDEAERPAAIEIADSKKDGFLDLFTVNGYTAPASGDSMQIYFGVGSGTFDYQGAYLMAAASSATIDVKLADFNGDEAVDAAAINYAADSLTVRPGTVSGTFNSSATISVGDGPYALAIGDLDGNGSPDLVVSLWNDDSVAVLLNAFDVAIGGVALSQPADESVGVSPVASFSWSNSTGDGVKYVIEIATDQAFSNLVHRSDPLVKSSYTLSALDQLDVGTVYLWRIVYGNAYGHSAQTDAYVFETIRVADLNADGCVNGADLANLLTQWGTDGGVTGSDLNGDGVVNGADLAILLVNWHDPCTNQDPPGSLLQEGSGWFTNQHETLEFGAEAAQTETDVPWILLALGWTSIEDYVSWIDGLTEPEVFDHLEDVLDLLLGE